MSAIQKEIKTYFTQLDNFYKKKMDLIYLENG